MTIIEKSNISKLIMFLKDMYKIISSNPISDTSYGKKNIVRIIEYLEEEMSNDSMDYEELVDSVMKSYKSMFPPRGGLSDFHIWDNDYEVRHKANHKYEQLKEQIEEVLKIKQ